MKNFLILILILTIICLPLYAQESSQRLSLKDCIQIALEKNFQINTYKNLYEQANLGIKQAYSNILPKINTYFTAGKYKVGEATFLGDAVDPITGEVKQITLIREGFSRSTHSANLNIQQNIFDGGFWWNNIRQRKVEKMAADFNFRLTENQVIKLVAQYYFDLLKQLKLLEVYSLAVQRSKDQLNRAQQMYEIGSVAQVDVYRAKVNYGQDRISFLNQENVVKQAKQRLNIAMGNDPLTPIEIEPEFKFEHELPPLDNLIHTAMQNQPELKSKEMDVRSKELSVALAKSKFFPTLGISFNYNRDNELLKKIYTDLNKNWTISYGVRFSFNLFNGFSDQVNYQMSKVNLKNAKLELVDLKRNLISKIVDLYNNYKAILEIVEINKTNLEAAREEYRLAKERYRLGSGTSLELREAQVNLTQAEQILVSTEYNAIITYIELQEAVGTVRKALNI